MAFFGSSKKSKSVENKLAQKETQPSIIPKVETPKDIIKTPTHDVSVLRDLLKVKANIEGGGSLIIGGYFDGDISIENTLFIEKGAKVNATIRAKDIKIAGEFEGTIYAVNAVEVTQSGKLKGLVNSNKAFLGGEVDGIIKSANSIEITKSGVVKSKECKSKNIKIVGRLEGKVIASELLEITSGGAVNGTIITKGIKTEQGGSVVGNIQTYDPSLNEESDLNSKNSSDDPTNLLNLDPKDLQKYARKDKDKSQEEVV